jgi:type IX secretion system PorP/SprF family membrane protein
MKKILLLFSLFIISSTTFAQQQAVYSNFMMNEYFYNPAIAGSKDVHLANLYYRNQWMGFEGAPVNFTANLYGSYKNNMKNGYGLSLTSSSSGLVNNTGVYVDYAHHFKLSNKVKLGFGVRPGYMQYRIRLYDAVVADQGDEVVTGSVYSANAFDVNAGFNLYSKKFFVMGSVQHLLSRDIQFTSFNSNLSFHYNLIGGYTFTPKKSKLEIQPAIMVKYVQPLPVQYSAMVRTTFNKKYWAGLIYRSDDALGLSLGMWIKERINLAYGYDYSLSPIRKYTSGSHEIALSIVITKKKPTLEELDEKLNNSILDEFEKNSQQKKQ